MSLKYTRFYLFISLLLCLSSAHSIPPPYYLIPINDGIGQGAIGFSSNSIFDIGNRINIFDGDVNTLARTPSVNPLVLNISLKSSMPIYRTRINSGTDAEWTMEIATSLNELNTQQGSYQKVFSNRPISANVFDDHFFPSAVSAKYIRITLHRTVGDDYVHIREWELYGPEPQYEALTLCPSQYYLVPNTKKNYKLSGLDNYGISMDLTKKADWSVGLSKLASIDSNGLLQANKVGNVVVTATIGEKSAQGKLVIGSEFKPIKAEKKKVNVALLIEDPLIPGSRTLRWHDRMGWNNPAQIASDLMKEMNNASEQTVEFTLANTIYGDVRFTYFDGMPVDSSFFYHRYLKPNGIDTLLYWAGMESQRLKYNYEAMLEYYGFCQQRDTGAIDEVWVLSHPAAAMYESRLAGKNGFWYNSPPITQSKCVKLLPIMGFNNAVSVDYAMHSIGHRVESSMAQAYGAWSPTSNPSKTPFDLFTRIEKDFPEGSHVGNIHFAPNSFADYAYSDTRQVKNFASNWDRYPLLANDSKMVTCSDWDCGQLGYMRWWFGHLPKYKGVTDGVLNDWWHYIVQFEDAQKYAQLIDSVCGNFLPYDIPTEVSDGFMQFEQRVIVGPNPSEGTIAVLGSNSEVVSLMVIDYLGRVVYEKENISMQNDHLDLSFLPKGLYGYIVKASAGNAIGVGKLALK